MYYFGLFKSLLLVETGDQSNVISVVCWLTTGISNLTSIKSLSRIKHQFINIKCEVNVIIHLGSSIPYDSTVTQP